MFLTSLFLLTFYFGFSQPKTSFSKATGEYAQLLVDLENAMYSDPEMKTDTIAGKVCTFFECWIRDHIHVTKAMKYLHADVKSFLELFLENQTKEGLYYDYYYNLNNTYSYGTDFLGNRIMTFDKEYWKVLPGKVYLQRLPVEADLEYLLVEGVYAVWQSTGDKEFVKKWISTLTKGMNYSMTDPLRWSERYGLVKRGYTIDTWDFMQLPSSREEYIQNGGDLNEGIFNINETTPMGIMHGDNSGMFAACNQLSELFKALGYEAESAAWKYQAEIFRVRTNTLCWNGKFYSHFIEDDPQPAYLKIDQRNTLSLSNPYDINRGLPTEEMAQSIIKTYMELKESNKANSFAEWYSIYPPVYPHFADYKPGSYVNGGVNTIVAGELAKAAFQHGYESYGVDILKRIMELMKKHNGLPVAYTPQGKVEGGIPDNWGQAAVYSAMIEGLAGVVDRGTQFSEIEISPRWMAAGKNEAEVTVAYGPTGANVHYTYTHHPTEKSITLQVSGNIAHCTARILLPSKSNSIKTFVVGKNYPFDIEKINKSYYVIVKGLNENKTKLEVTY